MTMIMIMIMSMAVTISKKYKQWHLEMREREIENISLHYTDLMEENTTTSLLTYRKVVVKRVQ
jgi:hypothetical protein